MFCNVLCPITIAIVNCILGITLFFFMWMLENEKEHFKDVLQCLMASNHNAICGVPGQGKCTYVMWFEYTRG